MPIETPRLSAELHARMSVELASSSASAEEDDTEAEETAPAAGVPGSGIAGLMSLFRPASAAPEETGPVEPVPSTDGRAWLGEVVVPRWGDQNADRDED
ncbi:hypothetical protein [Prosthecomicrobium sp. N25]|uniref:hypothetical protein n=1 Tax=Prosthecomicrobium sp. N25 TaxID=3129254 RepID=UPI003076BEDC